MPLVGDKFSLGEPRRFSTKASNFPLPNLFTGVEMELERAGELAALLQNKKSKYWEYHQDDSLKDAGCEAVFKLPFFGDDIKNACDEMRALLKQAVIRGDTLAITNRTSLHVHLNMADVEEAQAVKILLSFILVDEILFMLSHPHRKYNNFCMSASSATSQAVAYKTLINAWSDGVGDMRLAGHLAKKYMSVNIRSLWDHGTIELRHHGGTADMDEVIRWINICHHIYKFGLELEEDFWKVLFNVSNSLEETLTRIIPANYLGENLRQYRDALLAGSRVVQHILLVDDLRVTQDEINKATEA